jgi:hypothetical protein
MRAVNLIPAEQRSGQPVGAGRSQGGAYAVLALVAGVALLAFLYGRAAHQVSSNGAKVASLTSQAQRAQQTAEQLAPYTRFIALREQRTQAVETLVDSRFDWAHVLEEFGRVLPAETSITSLSGTITGVTGAPVSSPGSAATTPAATAPASTAATSGGSSVASVTPPGSVPSFTLAGCALSQSAVALTLERLHLIDGVKEVTLQSSAAGTSSGASTGGGGCSGHDASFSATVIFAPLPSSAAITDATKAATKTVSDQRGSGTSPAPSGTTGVIVK